MGAGQTIRFATEADARAVRAIYAPYVDGTAVSFEVTPPGVDEMAARIGDTLERFPWLVWVDDEVLGYAYAGQYRSRPAYRWSVEVSVYVHPDHHRAGVGRGLYESLLAVLRVQGFQNAYAGITLPNPASVGLHESLGFEAVGVYRDAGYKHGAWHDVGWWQRALGDRPTDPDPPTPLTDLRGATLDEALGAGIGSLAFD